MKNNPSKAHSQFTLERTYSPATLDEAWDLWTTKEGLESWWGPEGFEIKVESLDVRVGGELNYLMIAVNPEHVAYMTKAGLKVATPCKVTFTEVRPKTRLAYDTLTDFIPDVEPYEVGTRVELRQVGQGVIMTISFDTMHDDVWTARRKAGCESQLLKLDHLMAGRLASVQP